MRPVIILLIAGAVTLTGVPSVEPMCGVDDVVHNRGPTVAGHGPGDRGLLVTRCARGRSRRTRDRRRRNRVRLGAWAVANGVDGAAYAA